MVLKMEPTNVNQTYLRAKRFETHLPCHVVEDKLRLLELGRARLLYRHDVHKILSMEMEERATRAGHTAAEAPAI